MLITKDFVFIHMPKTGGTFVHGVFKKIIEEYRGNKALKWYFNRLLFKLKLSKPIYQKFTDIAYYEFPNNEVLGQHAGAAFIPKKYSKLPIYSVKRNPVKKFESAYYYRWWERFPLLSAEQLKERFPNYPNISMEEYFELENNHHMPYFFKDNFREDIGVLSWQFIRMYSTNPMYVYKNITDENYDRFKSEFFFDVRFCEMDSLANDFKGLLSDTEFSKFSAYFDTKERIYPPGSDPNKNRESMDSSLVNRFKNKEWLLYKFFPEYNI